ncbi:MAG: hypothetical protein NZ561_05285, partial [Phycisphaerae bacterium]|nr:hypothetical protein [Phycisphaerae bacterium]
AKVDPRQILAMLPARDGRVILGCANRGDVMVMTGGYASTGVFTSPVLDAEQISRFGRMRLRGTLPEGASLTVSTRSGNVSDPAGSGWSDWTPPVPAAEFLPIDAPPARFFQYRLTFGSSDGSASAVVEEVEVAYQLPNLPPKLTALRITPADPSNPDTRPKRIVSWEAIDQNSDALRYTLQFRSLPSGQWITIREKLTEPTFELDTRGIADGRYQLRVVASDALANAPGEGRTGSRVSDPMIVDNTPPVIGDLRTTVQDRSVAVGLSVVDQTSTVAVVEYSLNGADHWQTVLPADMIADSPREAYEFRLSDLTPGAYQLTLRATDSAGNRSFASLNFSIEKRDN